MNKKTSKFFMGLGGVAASALFFGMAAVAESNGPIHYDLKAQNLLDLEFAVPWGLRDGEAARVYFLFDVGADGMPENVEILRAYPHKDFVGVATTVFNRFSFAEADAGKRGLEELQYCFMPDQRSTVPCKITIVRENGDPAYQAKTLEDPGFYEIDKYGGAPRIKNSLFPYYPEKAFQRSLCGWVRASFEVTPKGRTRKIKITETSSGGTFSLVTMDFLRNLRFAETGETTEITYLLKYEIPGECYLDSPKT